MLTIYQHMQRKEAIERHKTARRCGTPEERRAALRYFARLRREEHGTQKEEKQPEATTETPPIEARRDERGRLIF